MDRTWMQLNDRLHPDYEKGIKEFLDFAFSHNNSENKIPCPCAQCNNYYRRSRVQVGSHLLVHGIVKSYTTWIHHGEDENSIASDLGDSDGDSEQDEMEEMIDDIATGFFGDNWQGNEPVTEESNLNVGDENPFLKLFRDAKENLYHGCEKASRLSFIVKMLHLKVTNGWSNKSFTELLQDLKGIIPGGENIPGSYHEAKKMIHDLGLGYIKIHACENNCILFRKEYEKLDNCPKCNTPRWTSDGKKRVARKVLRYFPLKPRLQRMFVNREVAQDMRWHKEKRKDNENLMSHPADSEAWKDFDKMHTLFASDPRNIRLGLATDGFNPFGNMSSTYSVWPVILVQYNLPPWKCMKDPFFIMSMLIPGPRGIVIRKRAQALIIRKRRKVGDVYVVEVPEELKRIVGKSAQALITESGIVIRKRAPLQVEKWKEIPEGTKETLWKALQAKFNLEDCFEVRRVVYAQLNSQYRNWRHKLHVHFRQHRSIQAALKDKHPEVTTADWAYLCTFFSKEKFKAMCERNSKSRGKQVVSHSTGTKSYARISHEQGDTSSSSVVGQIKLWELTHCNMTTGKWVDLRSKELYDQMLELQKNATDEGNPRMDDDICSEVLGMKSGYIRGRGPGPKPHKSSSTYINRAELEAATKRAVEAEEHNKVMAMEMQEMKARQVETEAFLKRMFDQMNAQGFTLSPSSSPLD